VKTEFRPARAEDVASIVDLLADDPLGATRETAQRPIDQRYLDAFKAIDADPNNELLVAARSGHILGVCQVTFIPSLTYTGSRRALIEGVRVDSSLRSSGLGRKLVAWAIERAREKGCRLVQLTSDKRRRDAIRFYESLGFVASHEGMKLEL
jgi:ribosomal protein S18 acetylase RimI-like enzyme